MNSNSDTDINVQAPWHLWLIGGLMALWNGFASFDYLATVFRYEPYLAGFPEEMLAHYLAAPLWMFGMWAIGAFGGFASAILLLMRNKLAVKILAVSLIAAVIAQIYGILNPPPGDSSVLLSMVIIVIAALVLVYANWLQRCGVLR